MFSESSGRIARSPHGNRSYENTALIEKFPADACENSSHPEDQDQAAFHFSGAFLNKECTVPAASEWS